MIAWGHANLEGRSGRPEALVEWLVCRDLGSGTRSDAAGFLVDVDSFQRVLGIGVHGLDHGLGPRQDGKGISCDVGLRRRGAS